MWIMSPRGAVGGPATGKGAICCPKGRLAPPGPRSGRQPAPKQRVGDGGGAAEGGDHGRLVVCASKATCAELATYSLELPTSTPLLESCVRQAVLHLDEAPCLHVAGTSHGPVFIRHPVPESVVAVPQLWQGIGETIVKDDPELLVLVQRVPDGSSPTVCLKLQLAAMAAHSTHEDNVQVWPQSSGAYNPWLSKDLVSGKVGDCCDEHDDHHHHGSSVEDTLGGQEPAQGDVSFWGLVIQSKARMAMEGCYLLKTVRNTDTTGCTCTHFSMNRVCLDVPLCEQFQAAWLV